MTKLETTEVILLLSTRAGRFRFFLIGEVYTYLLALTTRYDYTDSAVSAEVHFKIGILRNNSLMGTSASDFHIPRDPSSVFIKLRFPLSGVLEDDGMESFVQRPRRSPRERICRGCVLNNVATFQ